jgi:hypothetical protein
MTGSLRITCAWVFLAAGLATVGSADPYEAILNDVEDEEDYFNLLNQLDTIVREPVNLLDADRSELSRLPWVSPWLAGEIVDLRRRGELHSLDDLTKIEGVDHRLIELLRPFVTAAPPGKAGPRPEVALRMRGVASPVSSSFDEVKTYARFSGRYAAYDAGLLVEKDRYETRFNDLQTAFGGATFSWGRVIVGDLVMASGHGLLFSNPYGYSPSTVEPWRFSQGDFGIKPYSAVDENFALRGVGVELGRGQTDFCLVASRTHFDASLDTDAKVTSLGTTGIHAPGTGDGDALREDLLGFGFRTIRGPIGIGLDVLVDRYDHDFAIGRLDHLGTSWTSAGGINVAFTGQASAAFVQGTVMEGGGSAAIAGFGYHRRNAELLLLGRHYDRRFLSLHARPFAFYSGLATGEMGALVRAAFRLPGEVRVSIGNDLHSRRPVENGLARPSGSEAFLDIEVPAGDFEFCMGEKLLASEEPPAHEADPTAERARLRSRVDVRYVPVRWLAIRLRYENQRFSGKHGAERERSTSDLLRLDLDGRLGRKGVVKVGFQTFTIGSYDARIYQYEPGVPYYPAIEMLKSDGSRWYSILSFDLSPFGRLAAKYATTFYEDGGDRSQFLCYYSLKM